MQEFLTPTLNDTQIWSSPKYMIPTKDRKGKCNGKWKVENVINVVVFK